MRFKLCEIECFCKLAVVKMYYFAIDRQVEMLYLLLPPQGGKQLWSLKIGSQQSAFGSQTNINSPSKGAVSTSMAGIHRATQLYANNNESAEPYAKLMQIVEPRANLG
jgi:hypothetical protein